MAIVIRKYSNDMAFHRMKCHDTLAASLARNHGPFIDHMVRGVAHMLNSWPKYTMWRNRRNGCYALLRMCVKDAKAIMHELKEAKLSLAV